MRRELLLVILGILVALSTLVAPISAFPLKIGSDPESVAVNPVTNRVYVALPGQKALAVVDGETGRILKSVHLGRGGAGRLG